MNYNILQNSYLSKNGYVIKKDLLPNNELGILKKELVGRPLVDEKYNYDSVSFNLYTETKTKIYIPKIYGINRYGIPDKKLENYIGKKWESDIEFVGTLYPTQKEASDILLKELLEKSGGGILSIFTGGGKTFTTIYVLSKLKGKTLIIVNKITLMKQWENEINTCLPGINIGIIQGKKVDVEGKDVIVGMLQSLSLIDYPDSIFKDINTVVIDECHNVPSKVFSKVLMKTGSQYTIGLSATPKRGDGCEYVFKYFIGDIVYQCKSNREGLTPKINYINIKSKEYKEITVENKFTGRSQIQFTSMISELINMQKRNKLIIEIIKYYITIEKRKILILSDRREHLKNIQKLLDEDPGVFFTYGLFVGQMKFGDLEKSKASSAILATYSAFGEGISEKDLDTLFLITPKKYIGHLQNTSKNESGKLEQIVGRIFRKDHTEKHPLIIDFQDLFSVYKVQSNSRKMFYTEHFKNRIIIEQSIDLDKYTINDISFSSLNTIETIEDFKNTECIIDDN